MTTDRPGHEEFGRRPAGVDDATVDAVGALTKNLEWVERAPPALGEAIDPVRCSSSAVDRCSSRNRGGGVSRPNLLANIRVGEIGYPIGTRGRALAGDDGDSEERHRTPPHGRGPALPPPPS